MPKKAKKAKVNKPKDTSASDASTPTRAAAAPRHTPALAAPSTTTTTTTTSTRKRKAEAVKGKEKEEVEVEVEEEEEVEHKEFSEEVEKLKQLLAGMVAEKDRVIAGMVAEKDRMAAEKDRMAAEKDRMVAEKAEQDRVIAELQAERTPSGFHDTVEFPEDLQAALGNDARADIAPTTDKESLIKYGIFFSEAGQLFAKKNHPTSKEFERLKAADKKAFNKMVALAKKELAAELVEEINTLLKEGWPSEKEEEEEEEEEGPLEFTGGGKLAVIETNNAGLRGINVIKAVDICHRLGVAKEKYETWWRVNIWGPIMDGLLSDIPGLSDHRELASGSVSTRPPSQRGKIPDMQIKTISGPSGLSDPVTLLDVEEKTHGAADSNTAFRNISEAAYKSKQADRLKLGKLLRFSLQVRQAKREGQVAYGIQWVGGKVNIFSARCLQQRYTTFTQLFAGGIDSSDGGDLSEVLQAMLALRKLLEAQYKFERSITSQEREQTIQIRQTPVASKNKKFRGAGRGSSSSSSTKKRKAGSGSGVKEESGEKDCIMDEELFASVMTLHPMPPDPVKKEHKVLPGSMARYCNLKKMFSHPWDESSVWQAERVGDGLPVALKHIVCDLWRGEQELSMHLSANGAPGVVPLLDSFWDRPRGFPGWSSFRVLVMPLLSSLCSNERNLHQSRTLNCDEIALCVKNMLECLTVLHEERLIVHMDIKPSNILIDCRPGDGSIKEFLLSDFGLSRVVGTHVNHPIGTDDYMPPELLVLQYSCSDSIEVSPKQDIYSLGCTFAWLLKHNSLEGGTEMPLRNLVDKMCHYEPEERPTAREAQHLLARVSSSWNHKNSLCCAEKRTSGTTSTSHKQMFMTNDNGYAGSVATFMSRNSSSSHLK